ncbi:MULTISPECIES: hypothetical protein [Oxalobacteraceae]|uniref:hypothetical protein n=1 Tax=Oxalobacteraceae TaxID=75682 RepID=UPI002AC9748B|nr:MULTISPECIES: hypothetical protein [Oxalobacteraceae]MEB0014731.1 hypothetical protein [Glaciimonas sp. Cout2]MEB0139250.1 hypothetical protein [Undibacterium sp. CCC2.1]MEB0172094.1 hypothetical protein [Undibacterium sp. CCC1.1]MEB0175969.1 hypothetical protein [Undibacterium sp. CCC3.4]MEB0215281.1 hypothetical protein [Undibacterium sp. 5I2]
MKLRTKRRHYNYSRLVNHQLATVLESAFEEFRLNFSEEGQSLTESLDALQKLGASYRHFKKFALRFAASH